MELINMWRSNDNCGDIHGYVCEKLFVLFHVPFTLHFLLECECEKGNLV
jgi:hypothetical protein